MSRLPDCHSRRIIDGSSTKYFCAHPRVHARGQLVTAETCRTCEFDSQPPPAQFRPFPPRRAMNIGQPCFYLGEQIGLKDCQTCNGSVKLKAFDCRHALHDDVTRKDCEICSDYEPLLKRGCVRRWAVGMTTAPRGAPTIDRCLSSLVRAGWNQVMVFAEPETPVSPLPGVSVARRARLLGAVRNWFLGLSELVQSQPDADAYLMLQDDVVFARDVRGLLEQLLWPDDRVGAVSVYCPEPYRTHEIGFQRLETTRGLLGALCLVIPAATARWLATSGLALLMRWHLFSEFQRNLDTLIGQILAHAKLPVFCFWPSLSDHIGDSSTLWPSVTKSPKRSAADFVGESCEARSFASAPMDSDRSSNDISPELSAP